MTVDLGGAEPERAYVLTQLTGGVAVGDRVVLNTTAVDLGLGTGGWHVVHWNLERDTWSEPGPGHIMKLRYTSLQADTGAAEEHLADLPTDLAGMPVVACTVHSQVAVVAAAIAHRRPGARVAFVMTDGAALPLVLSDLVSALLEAELLVGTVTAGHAFGGDHEAVTVPSALTIARHHLHADVTVVGMGPGVVGTASALGTTAIEAADVLDRADALGGTPILCARMSADDGRERHRGLSHHSARVLELTRVQAQVALPSHATADAGRIEPRHQVVEMPVQAVHVAELLDRSGLAVTTMGRGPAEDPLFFEAACAAGFLATERLASDGEPAR